MKRPNPYIWLTIIWSVLTVAFAVASVVLFVDGQLAIGAFLVCVCGGFAFTAGRLFEKAVQIAEMNRQAKWLHDFAKELQEFGKAVENANKKEVDGDPFAEFINERNVPFAEVERKEK
jgi:hypothetical protein